MTVRFILLCSQNRLLRLAILPAQCPQLHNQRVFQPASLATAQAPAVFLFNHCGRLSPFNWTLCLPSRKMQFLLLSIWPRVRTICWSVRTICWSVVRCDSPFHLTLFTEPSPASSYLASTVSPTTQSASVPASIIGYSTSSSSISVQSLWETEPLQLDTVSTIKEDVVSSSIYFSTGRTIFWHSLDWIFV